jgi:hypothetical protein
MILDTAVRHSSCRAVNWTEEEAVFYVGCGVSGRHAAASASCQAQPEVSPFRCRGRARGVNGSGGRWTMDIYVRLHLLLATLLVLASYRLQRQAVYVAKRRPASWCAAAYCFALSPVTRTKAWILVRWFPPSPSSVTIPRLETGDSVVCASCVLTHALDSRATWTASYLHANNVYDITQKTSSAI